MASQDQAGMYAALLRWLGPWAPEDRAPEDVVRTAMTIPGEGPFEAWVYRPKAKVARGTMLVCPGVHYAGPADPRLDRFNRILASAGILTLCPFLPDFCELIVRPSVVEDLERTFDCLLGIDHRPRGVLPGVFSVSFGSLPTLRLAAKRGPEIGEVLVFGGYADFATTLRFCVGSGVMNRRRDPLNQPVVMMNALDTLPGAPEDPEPLRAAWRKFAMATWGRAQFKVNNAHHPVAKKIAEELPKTYRELFLIGCGVAPGAPELLEAALAARTDGGRFLDPRPYLSGLQNPVHLCHGMDDDVIPPDQLDALAAAIPQHVPLKTYLTGLYDHTGKSPLEGILAAPRLAKESLTLIGILRALVNASTRPAPKHA